MAFGVVRIVEVRKAEALDKGAAGGTFAAIVDRGGDEQGIDVAHLFQHGPQIIFDRAQGGALLAQPLAGKTTDAAGKLHLVQVEQFYLCALCPCAIDGVLKHGG